MKIKNVGIIFICLFIFICANACTKKTAEEKGKELAGEKIDIVKGIGEGLKEKGQSAGEAIGEGISKSFKGVGEGVDKAFAVEIRLDPKFQAEGIKVTKAQVIDKQIDNQKKNAKNEKGISIYIICNNGLNGKLLLKAIDKQEQEFGRSFAISKMEGNNAGYVDFIFDERVQLSDAKYFSLEKVENKHN